jgi:flotillin
MEFLLLIPVILVVLAVVGLIMFIAYRRAWRIPPPNQALIIVGKSRGSSPGAVVAQDRIDGSGQTAAEAIEEDRLEGLDFRIATSATWVNPLTSRTFPLGLNSRSTTFTADGHDKDKVAVSVRGVLLYKVADNYDAIARAARRFLDVDDKSMNQYIEQLITGQVRALVGAMSVEQLITDRQTLMDRVREATAQDMAVLGLKIDSLTIQEVADSQGYIDNLGRPQAEMVARQASIAADQARQAMEEAKQAADVEIARVRRDTEVQAAEYQAEQDRARETAAQSGPLARAQAESAVVAEQTKVAESQVSLASKRYDAEVRERASADRFRVEQEAEANKASELAAVEAEAARERQIGEARAAAIRAQGEAEATSVELRGVAEATAIEKKGQALGENGELVIQQTITDLMPEIASAVAGPLGKVDNLVVLDGPEGLTKAVTGGIAAAGTAAEQIRGLVTGEGPRPDGSDPGSDGGGGPAPLPPDPEQPEPARKRPTGDAAPELSSIMGEGYKPSPDASAGLDEGREQITAYAQGDFPALDRVMDHFGGLEGAGARELKRGLDELSDDQELRIALQEVAEDDAAFDQALAELPLTGAKREAAVRFLASYREGMLTR